MSASSGPGEPPLRVTTIPPPPHEEVHEHREGPDTGCQQHLTILTGQTSTDASTLDSMTELLAQAAERNSEKEALCASIVGTYNDELARTCDELSQTREAFAESDRSRVQEIIALREELARVRDALAESESMRSREATLARQSSGSQQVLERAVMDADAEAQRLRTALEAEQARTSSAEGSRQAAAAEINQLKALATGARLKNQKLEADVQRERAKCEAAAAHVAAAEAQAAAAAQMASNVQGKVASETHAALEREVATRKQAEKKAEALRMQLAEAMKACEAASAECARVRRRNEQLERELASERELANERHGEGPQGLGAVFDRLDEMETMCLDPASSKEAERRLRERAKRVNAGEVVHVVDRALDK